MNVKQPLKLEFEFYLKNQEKLLKKYKGKFIVIKNKKVIGSYASNTEAYQESIKNNDLGTFLIQECLLGAESHTQVFHSRVVFN